MEDFRSLYFHLFNRISDAIEMLEKNEYTAAKKLLISAQQETEEMYIADECEANHR